MSMLPKFEIVAVSTGNEQELPSVKIVIVDDERFLGYIFHFNEIKLEYETDGIGVSYDLVIDIHKDYLPTTLTNEQMEKAKKVAYSILEKVISDFIESHNSGALSIEALDNSTEMM